MKKLVSIILLFGLITCNFHAFAQDNEEKVSEKMPVYNGFFMNLPGMTDVQKEEFTKARIEHQKIMRQMHALLQEQRAHLNTLRLADQPDQDAINKTIDEITATHAKLMKARESHLIDMRSKLTEEQKAFFDARHQRQGFGKGRFAGRGGCCRMGPCWNNDDRNNGFDGGDDNSNRQNFRPRRFNK
ncbi:MAG TPA: periplasmic heavy metal sensor [Lentimicrobium sp.]|nr:periplasmic heavy metal sensor [Lentimicrobium sp.]